MLQRLLVDRFQLQVRTEQRAATIFELVVAKGCPMLTSSKGDNPARRGCLPHPAACTDVSMDDFADYLSAVVMSQLVVNKTDLP
jgi:uncharacterized protein (TIGR03435 family)